MILKSGQRCCDVVAKTLFGGDCIAEPDTPSFSITEADVGHGLVFGGERNLANVAGHDLPRNPILGR